MLYILTIASRGELYDKLLTNYWVPFIKMINKNYSNNVKIQLLFGNDVDISFLEEIKDNILICNTKEQGYGNVIIACLRAAKWLNIIPRFQCDFPFDLYKEGWEIFDAVRMGMSNPTN